MDTEKAVAITSQTLVGIGGERGFPFQHGNCFSVRTEEDKIYKIVNFCAENLEELVHRGLEFPFQILPLSEHVALIHDSRIPDNWYQHRYCEVCCPEELLPHPQQMAHKRQEERGERVVGDGWISIYPDKVPVIPGDENSRKRPISLKVFENLGDAVSNQQGPNS